MNVLILTPDRVGSTLLQRLLTVYMLQKGFDKPVINLHELTNGLIRYYNPTLKQETLGKPTDDDWGYWQSLPEIIEILESADHYKTSRLAHYHLINRNDNISNQLQFYEYLNKNFYIISCRRENLFEHSLSWAIQAHSKKLNVYSPQEKIHNFKNIYDDGITVSQEGFEKYLNNYVKYINWSNTYFNIQSYFDYDTHMKNIEDYIINLDFMKSDIGIKWKDMFGLEFSDWNTCHRLIPNLFLRQFDQVEDPKLLPVSTVHVSENKWQQIRGQDWPETWADFGNQNLPLTIEQEIKLRLGLQLETVPVTDNEYHFLTENLSKYKNTVSQIEQLKNDGIMVTGIPLKLQSLAEKKQIIKNFSDCVVWYNRWVDQNNFGKHYSESDLNQLAHNEELILTQSVQQLAYTNCKLLGG